MLLYSVAQMLLVAWALAYGLCYLARLGCRRWVRLGLLALFCLGPQISLHVLGCTKDIPFAAFITVFAVRLHQVMRNPRLLRSRRWVAGTVAVGVFMVLFRNNAPYALVLLVPFAAALAGRGARLRMTALLAAVLVLGLGAGKGLQLATGAKKRPGQRDAQRACAAARPRPMPCMARRTPWDTRSLNLCPMPTSMTCGVPTGSSCT